jgi:hypothetical protein
MYLVAYNDSDTYQLTDWPTAFSESKKIMDLGGMEHPQKDAMQKEIDAIKAGTVNPNSPYHTNPYATPMASKNYTLDASHIDQLTMLVKTKLPHTPQQDFVIQTATNGGCVVMRKKFHHATPVFQVGKNLDSSLGKPFMVMAHAGGGMKMFDTWEQAFNYIEQNIYNLAGIKAPASVTQVAYTGNEAPTELPPHSTSAASYSVHAGITKAPTQTIRLTQEDENTVMAAGFKPQMVGGNVCYRHTGTGDVAKFYPNNMAKMVFANFPSAGTNQKIPNMIAWITTKYSPTVTQSPIKTGASVTAPAQSLSTGGVTKGVPAGIMFDMQIKNAGFQWDPVNTQYVHPGTGNTLKIAPDRKSVITFSDGIKVPFKDLPSLVSYLLKQYPAKAAQLPAQS